MSVFDKLRLRRSTHAGKKLPDELTQGLKYECYDFTQRVSEFKDPKTDKYPLTLVAHFIDPTTSNKYYITMPQLNNDLAEDDVKQLKQYIQDKKPPYIVFYGKDGKRNDLVLHEYGEAIDTEKLQRYLKKEDGGKRQHDEGETDLSPAKRAHTSKD